MEKWHLLIYAPAYNVGKQISEFLSKSKEVKADLGSRNISLHKLIIVDDGSIDDTNSLISKFIKQNSFVRLLRNKRNLGPLKTLLKGMREAKEILERDKLVSGNTIVVRIDTDMEHNPDNIRLILEPIISGKASMVVGVSDFKHYQPTIRFFNKLIGVVESRKFLGETIPQFCPGFYAMKADLFYVLTPKMEKGQELYKKEFEKDMLTIDFVILAVAKRMGVTPFAVLLQPVEKKWVKKSSVKKIINYLQYHNETMKFLEGHLQELSRL